MSSINAKITSKGQVTLPREIRERLGVRDGDRVRFEIENGQVVLYPQRDTPSFRNMIGLAPLAAGENAKSVVADLRHDSDEEADLRATPSHPKIRVQNEP